MAREPVRRGGAPVKLRETPAEPDAPATETSAKTTTAIKAERPKAPQAWQGLGGVGLRHAVRLRAGQHRPDDGSRDRVVQARRGQKWRRSTSASLKAGGDCAPPRRSARPTCPAFSG